MYWHVSPSDNRGSILTLGLRHADLGPAHAAWAPGDGTYIKRRTTLFSIPGQLSGTYLAHDIEGAMEYCRHLWERFWPARGRVASLDIWEVRLPDSIELIADEDWYTPASCVQADIPSDRLTLLRTVTVPGTYAEIRA